MSDLEPGVQLTPSTSTAMERLSTQPTTKLTMSEQYKATILELGARIEALEATQHAHFEGAYDRCLEIHEYVPTVKESLTVPAGSLVERVQRSINDHIFNEEACAAILEVAAWMRSELNGHNAADRLEQEANR